MKTRSKNLERYCGTKRKTSLTLGFKFCLRALRSSCLTFCFVASVSGAEIATEQLDPTDFLMSHSAKTSQDANTPNIKDNPGTIKAVLQPPMQVVELPSDRQEKAQTTPVPAEITPVNFTAQVEEKSPEGDFIIASNPESLLARQLWQERITVSKDEMDQRSKNGLKQIIEQIRSVEFEPQGETLEPVVVTELVSTAKPAETLPDTQLTDEPKEKQAESENQSPSDRFANAKNETQNAEPLPYRTVTDHTLQFLENISQHPEQLNNPFELAEVLFLSGHLNQALTCYQEALKRNKPDEAHSAQDRAWILFQVGNCLRNVDRPMAMKTYRQLIAEYPDSPWADLAKAQEKLIDWFQKDKPMTLINKRQFGSNDGKSKMEYTPSE